MATLIGIKFGNDKELSYIEVVHGELDKTTEVYGFEGSTDTFRKSLPKAEFNKAKKQGELVMAVTLK